MLFSKQSNRQGYLSGISALRLFNIAFIFFFFFSRNFQFAYYLHLLTKTYIMKKTVLFLSALLALSLANAQTLTTPQPSPTQTIKQNFALGSVELSYSRPAKKGRKIMGDLVPFGKVWRTGANAATTLTFSEDVTIGGKEVKAGKYGLLTIPDAGKWTIIISKDVTVNQFSRRSPG